MICDRILGNLEDGSFAVDPAGEVDVLELNWQECGRRFLRKTTRGGREAGLLLPAGSRVRQGDVLHAPPGLTIVAAVMPTEVLVVRATTPGELATLAYTLGGMHSPAEIMAGAIVVPTDDAVAGMLDRLGFSYSRETRRFQPLGASPGVEWQSSPQLSLAVFRPIKT